MLRFEISEDKITFFNVGWLEPQPTRYEGEPWDWIAVELACGIADPFPDVGLLVEAGRDIRNPPLLDPSKWTKMPLENALQIPQKFGSVVCSKGDRDYYLPGCREAFEEIVYHYQPSLLSKPGATPFELAASASITAFSARNALLKLLRQDSSRSQSVVDEAIGRAADQALFELYWNAGAWMITAKAVDVKHLAKLADPVMSRINGAIVEC